MQHEDCGRYDGQLDPDQALAARQGLAADDGIHVSGAIYHGGIKIPPQVIALDVKTQIIFTLFQQLKLAAFFGEKISQFAFCATEFFGYVSFARDTTVILQAAWHILFLLHSMVL